MQCDGSLPDAQVVYGNSTYIVEGVDQTLPVNQKSKIDRGLSVDEDLGMDFDSDDVNQQSFTDDSLQNYNSLEMTVAIETRFGAVVDINLSNLVEN